MEGIQISAYNVGNSGDVALLQVGGYIDNVTSGQLEVAIGDVISQGMSRLIIDLSNVNYISSAGWGVFLGKIKGLREQGGDLVIAQMIPDVADVFELLEFHRVLKSFDNIESAVAFFDENGSENSQRSIRDETGSGRPVESDGVEDAGVVQENTPDTPSLVHEEPEVSPPERRDTRTGYEKNLLSLTEVDDGPVSPPEESEPEDLEAAGESGEEQLPVASFYDSMGMSSNVMDRDLPLAEKIKLLVIDNPLSGPWKIKSALNSSRFGYIKVGFFEVRSILRELDLDSKEKRYRFWRSR